jgi:hypothetical protein
MRPQGNHQAKWLFATAVAVALLVAPFAGAAGEGDPIEGGVRNPSNNQTQELQRETEIIANTSTYGTRQSNKSNNGGGAIYGCRSAEGGTPRGNEPCIRANNLANGLAFEFESDGKTVGRIDAEGGGGEDTRPFTTNATGVATGLNADRVDGRDGEQLFQRWALINEAGQIEQQTGGFAIVNCYQANDNCYIDANEDVRNNGLHAQIVVQNVDSINGNDSVLSGETGVAPCGGTFVNCAPPGTEDNEVVVVAPRRSNGQPTDAGTRQRFYVFVTGSQSTS